MPYAELIRINEPHGIFLTLFAHTLGIGYALTVGNIPLQNSMLANAALRIVLWVVLCRSAGCAWNDGKIKTRSPLCARCS